MSTRPAATGSRFRFEPAHVVAAAAADIDAVYALASKGHSTFDVDARTLLLPGIAARLDITPTHIANLLDELDSRNWAVLAALLNNPTVQANTALHARARRYISPESVPALIGDLDNPLPYLPDMLLAIARGSRLIPDLPRYINEAFSQDQVHQALDTLVAEHVEAITQGTEGRRDLGRLSWLTPEHIDTLIEAIENSPYRDDATQPGWVINSTLDDLATQENLSDEQGHRLFDLVEQQVINQSRQGWSADHKVTQFLAHEGLPHSVFVRALVDPKTAPAVIASMRHGGRVNLSGPMIVEALSQGADLRLLSRVNEVNMPVDLIDTLIDRFAGPDGAALHGTVHAEALTALVRCAHRRIGEPVWDRLYHLWCTQGRNVEHLARHDVERPTGKTENVETVLIDSFVSTVAGRSINWADASRVPQVHLFAQWASSSVDPRLRRHAVDHCYSVEQVALAAQDPAWQVRAAAAKHHMVTPEVLASLVGDPSVAVRLIVAAHDDTDRASVGALIADRSASVRLAVASRDDADGEVLRALADDTSKKVSEAVAERFIGAFGD